MHAYFKDFKLKIIHFLVFQQKSTQFFFHFTVFDESSIQKIIIFTVFRQNSIQKFIQKVEVGCIQFNKTFI